MRRSVAGLTAGLVLAAAGLAQADETTFCNAYITTLPYTISVQGHYCFNRNLSTAITTGAAITINTDFVVLDLNNFKLGGGAAGLGTEAIGVRALNHSNITIRNGNIRGFYRGIHLEDANAGSGNHLVENNVLDGNTFAGAVITGSGTVFRNNTVLHTGGSTVTTYIAQGVIAYDIYGGGFQLAKDNFVSDVHAGYPGGFVYGIFLGDYGSARGNVVAFEASGDDFGIGVIAGMCRENDVAFAYAAFVCDSATGNISLN